jgi:two-component system KDP operon response regulator KdpE
LKALVIEKNEDIVANLSLCLQVRWPGISIVSADEGDKGVELVESESPDIVIVDLDQSRSDRFAVMRDIRYVSNVPIVALSELGADMDKARGLEQGADEYITKPFSPIEFLARVRALLRRINHAELVTRDSVYAFGELSINFVTREVRIGKDLVRLTPTEYKLLYYLVRNVGKIVSRRALVEKVWGSEYVDQTDYLRKYVHRLRKKLRCGLDSPHNILTEQGQGYRFIHRDLASFQDRYRQ